MTIVDRSSEKSDLESVGCKRSGSLNFPGGDGNGMDSGCSSWGAGGPSSSAAPRVKTGGCMGPTPGATVNSSSADRPKEQGEEGWCAQLKSHNRYSRYRQGIFGCLLPVGRLVVVGNQAYHCCVVCKLDD